MTSLLVLASVDSLAMDCSVPVSFYSCHVRKICQNAVCSILVPDPCLNSPCDINADCQREGVLSDQFSCTCISGFTGDGLQCTGKFL